MVCDLRMFYELHVRLLCVVKYLCRLNVGLKCVIWKPFMDHRFGLCMFDG